MYIRYTYIHIQTYTPTEADIYTDIYGYRYIRHRHIRTYIQTYTGIYTGGEYSVCGRQREKAVTKKAYSVC